MITIIIMIIMMAVVVITIKPNTVSLTTAINTNSFRKVCFLFETNE